MRRLFSVMWFLFAAATLAMPVAAGAQIIDITIAPPELPVYEQPPIPAPGYIWAPGYWAFDPDDGYYWVPSSQKRRSILPLACGLGATRWVTPKAEKARWNSEQGSRSSDMESWPKRLRPSV